MVNATLHSLPIDRAHSNLQFSSWRLARGMVKGAEELGLPGPPATQDTSELDYVHTRFAALHNNLLAERFLFLRCGEALALQELQQAAAGGPALASLAVLDGLGSSPAPVEPALAPSIVEVLTSAEPQGGQTQLLLVSRGLGDLQLLLRQPGGTGALSSPVYPLRPLAPLQGCRPFVLEAAMQLPGGSDIRCVVWAVRDRAPDAAPGAQPLRCEVYAVTLAVVEDLPAEGGTAAPADLGVKDVQLLRRSKLPPHGVLANPELGSLLLALEPAPEAPPAGAAANGSSGAADANSSRPFAEPVDDSGDPVSPRTLAAAVARLEQFTSEEPAPGLPPNQWADLYSESGPDGVGDMGQEPACALYAYDAALACMEQVACQPHKVLTCHPHGGRLLLGLTDDVDCTVFELAAAAAAGGGADAADAAAGSGGAVGGFLVRHVSSIPALAYVAAGKLQRKFLLLAPPCGSSSSIAAALVESHRFAYLYRPTQPSQQYGEHEVLELGLPEGSLGVLGAALLGGGGAAGAQRLVLLTAGRLRVYHL